MHISQTIFVYMEKDLEILQSRFWYRVDDLLIKKGKTLQELSESAGIKYPTILSWRARKRLPDLISALCIAEFFGVSVEHLLELPSMHTDLKRQIMEAVSDATPERLERYRPAIDSSLKAADSFADLVERLAIDLTASEE